MEVVLLTTKSVKNRENSGGREVITKVVVHLNRQSLQLKNLQTGVGVQKSSKVFLVSKNGFPYKLDGQERL